MRLCLVVLGPSRDHVPGRKDGTRHRVPKKKGGLVKYYSMMFASMLRLVGALGCTVGTQKMFPVVTRHNLVSYLSVSRGYERRDRPV